MGNDISPEVQELLRRLPHPREVKAVESWFGWSMAVVPRFSKLYILNSEPVVFIFTRSRKMGTLTDGSVAQKYEIEECTRLPGWCSYGEIEYSQYFWFKYKIPEESCTKWKKFTEKYPEHCVSDTKVPY